MLNLQSQRIAEIIRRKNKQRLAKEAARAKKEAAGDFSHLKNKKGQFVAQPLPQPTLPNVSLDDDDGAGSTPARGPTPGAYGATGDFYGGKEYGLDYPPMPAYNQPYAVGNDAFHQYNPSVGTLPEDQHYDDNDYGSTANLTLGAAPIGYPDDQRAAGNDIFAPRPMHGAQEHSQLYAYNAGDPHAAYRGPSPVSGTAKRGPSPVSSHELAYDDTQPYQYQYQYQPQDGYGHGYPPTDHQRGTQGGYEYDAGQPHAL